MTIAELKAEIAALGGKAPAKATKAELEEMLASLHAAPEGAPAEPEDAAPEAAPVVMETTALLNVRTVPDDAKSPSTLAGEPLKAGTRVIVVSVDGNWARLDDGTYCMAKFLREG